MLARRNFQGGMTSLGGGTYEVKGTASGTDSSSQFVTVNNIEFTFHVVCRAGRTGGCTKTYLDGSLTITK